MTSHDWNHGHFQKVLWETFVQSLSNQSNNLNKQMYWIAIILVSKLGTLTLTRPPALTTRHKQSPTLSVLGFLPRKKFFFFHSLRSSQVMFTKLLRNLQMKFKVYQHFISIFQTFWTLLSLHSLLIDTNLITTFFKGKSIKMHWYCHVKKKANILKLNYNMIPGTWFIFAPCAKQILKSDTKCATLYAISS